jgi:hypothetical protein
MFVLRIVIKVKMQDIQDKEINKYGRNTNRMQESTKKSRWVKDFSHLSRSALGPKQPPIKWVPVSFPEGKPVEAWR